MNLKLNLNKPPTDPHPDPQWLQASLGPGGGSECAAVLQAQRAHVRQPDQGAAGLLRRLLLRAGVLL